ncbi:MAG: alanine racemase [Neisseriaceae bacterium]|nr:alanine racemase [Neisseriaceae bacterium]
MRPLTATINLSHLKDNYQFLKQQHGGKTYAVIKADAYGHGAVSCARALESEADGFIVAFLEEAQELRAAGIEADIVLLEGVFEASEYAEIERLNLSCVIQNEKQLQEFLQYSWKKPVCVWLKMDTGMRRAGFFPQDYVKAHQQLAQHSAVREIVKITHFSRADELSSDWTQHQTAIFDQTCAHLSGLTSLANSAGILAHSATHRDIGRAGIALYGISPFEDTQDFSGNLKPVMTLTSQIFGVRTLRAGESLGYGAIFTAQQDMRIGLLACGYADGYPRVPSNDNPVWIDGKQSRVIGRVSMDMMMVELNAPTQNIGSSVELWGEHISVAEIARRSGTISYEVLCHVKRAHKQWI